jgi:cation:H+ antiporter
MEILVSLLILLGGIALLIVGGDLLVRGSVTIAGKLGVSPLVIGLTVVAFGTSSPELALNAIAAFKNQTDLCFGNIVGSNIANVGLILGLTALIRPLQVHSQVIRREMPMMIIASLALLIMAIDLSVLGTSETVSINTLRGAFHDEEGVVLLGGFVAFFLYQLHVGRRGSKFSSESSQTVEELEEQARRDRLASLPLAIAFFVIGLGGLIGGGELAGTGAARVALGLGMGEDLIGLTIVALATSLPELATSIIAIRRGQTDIAVGNIVGSNLFNILLVLGATATIQAVPVPPQLGPMSLAIMLLLSFLLLPMCRTKNRHISRVEGLVLLSIYVLYMAWSVWREMRG